MRKLLCSALTLALAGTLAVAAPRQEGNDEHGNQKHDDNGGHFGWLKHHQSQKEQDEDADWDFDHEHLVPGHYYPRGRFVSSRQKLVAVSVNYSTRRVTLDDHSTWVVASHDIERCRDWRWDKDDVQVRDDEMHPGWYVLLNARLGQHVHGEYFGRVVESVPASKQAPVKP
jgi:hypothetical protein